MKIKTQALAAGLSALAFGLVAGGSASAAQQPYGADDAGYPNAGFRNVLPPGEAGVDNAIQFGVYTTFKNYPAHWRDQLPLYANLIYASPHLTHAQIADYYKDATFGVKPADVASTETPIPGVTIVRDKQWGIPHIYGNTREDVAFGAGYAGAEDRLFLMDVLRHTGRAQLSSFVGGSPSNRAMDETQWRLAPYTEQDLQSQVDAAPALYGQLGTTFVSEGQAYVNGINAYITNARINPTLMPFEYTAIEKQPQPWTLTDVIATASLIGGIFGKGGGNELNSALTLQAFEKRFGTAAGKRAWGDFRSKNDPEAPTTILHERFPYETASAFSARGLALPDPGSVSDAKVASVRGGAGAANGPFANLGAQLMQALTPNPHASNWELVAARHSRNGHAIAVMGPQVGYYLPEILMEEDLHGPGFEARGAAFPGVNLFVQLGHGSDYAWSATSAGSDNVDTFAEVLCGGDRAHYLYRGRCLAMDKLVRHNSWTPNLDDRTAAGSETLTAYRTVHGIVYAYGKVHGRPVAYATARTTYFHEADSAIGFSQLNDPSIVHDARSFEHAAANINFTFNWAYVDADHIAYYQSGWYPQRAARTSPDFPVLGTGAYDWRGYDPATHTATWLPYAAHPNVIDPDYLVSWNNKQAPAWAAADSQYGYSPIYRSALIADRVRADIAHGRKMGIEQLVTAMDEPATEDIRAVYLLPLIRRAIGTPSDPKLRAALSVLTEWQRAGGHRRDLDRNGQDEYTPAIELMDAWWPKLLAAEFRPALGSAAFDRLEGMLGFGGTSFSDGWYGYVSKDLRDVFGPRPAGPWSRSYCGGGSRARCRAALQQSLRAALAVKPSELYRGKCASDPQPSCSDQNRWTVASAISIPPFPFQNRPTFQQVVELTRRIPR